MSSCARGTVRVIPDPGQCRPRDNPPTAGRISKMKNFKDEKYPSGSLNWLLATIVEEY